MVEKSELGVFDVKTNDAPTMEVELTGVQTLAVALVSGSRRLEPHNGGGK